MSPKNPLRRHRPQIFGFPLPPRNLFCGPFGRRLILPCFTPGFFPPFFSHISLFSALMVRWFPFLRGEEFFFLDFVLAVKTLNNDVSPSPKRGPLFFPIPPERCGKLIRCHLVVFGSVPPGLLAGCTFPPTFLFLSLSFCANTPNPGLSPPPRTPPPPRGTFSFTCREDRFTSVFYGNPCFISELTSIVPILNLRPPHKHPPLPPHRERISLPFFTETPPSFTLFPPHPPRFETNFSPGLK